ATGRRRELPRGPAPPPRLAGRPARVRFPDRSTARQGSTIEAPRAAAACRADGVNAPALTIVGRTVLPRRLGARRWRPGDGRAGVDRVPAGLGDRSLSRPGAHQPGKP